MALFSEMRNIPSQNPQSMNVSRAIRKLAMVATVSVVAVPMLVQAFIPSVSDTCGVRWERGAKERGLGQSSSHNYAQNALHGKPPVCLGKPDLHHAGQMPGSGIHEVIPTPHRGNLALHPNKFNQGVTPKMRIQDRQLHWWYRAREQGADQIFPDDIYN